MDILGTHIEYVESCGFMGKVMTGSNMNTRIGEKVVEEITEQLGLSEMSQNVHKITEVCTEKKEMLMRNSEIDDGIGIYNYMLVQRA